MKTAQEFRAHLEAMLAEGVNMRLYLGIGDAAARRYKRANFVDGATEAVCQNYVAGIRKFFENEELTTLPLSEMDQRGEVLLMYDMREQPAEFAQLAALQELDEPEFFSFEENSVSDIRTIAVKISSAEKSVLFFKKFYPVSLVKRDQILLYKSNNRFTVFDGDILKITPGFEVMLTDGEFYINDFAKFEKSFAFSEIANRAMQAVAQTILAMGIVNDHKGYLVACTASKKDILRTARSDVLQLGAALIVEFALQKQDKIGLKIVDGKFLLSSRESVRKLYKLLNDDYLTSGLTFVEYETLAKNRMI